MKRNIIKELRNWQTSEIRKPLILYGARQVGKTYILREFGKKDFPRCHYVNFENDERLRSVFDDGISPRKIINELQFLLDCSINKAEDLVIFDEIQQCPRALTSLKYLARKCRSWRYAAPVP